MAYLNETLRGSSLFSGVANFFAGIADDFARYRTFRRTFDELNALSTREMNDLGISRSMITRIAYEAAYGPKA